jgi:hypothetical protein
MGPWCEPESRNFLGDSVCLSGVAEIVVQNVSAIDN